MSALKRLQIEYKKYLTEPNEYYSIEEPINFLEWNIILFGPINTIYENGLFNCTLIFTNNYPTKPPIFKFNTPIPHPNIYSDGKVCMSILNEGVDQYAYEDINERWTPAHSVNSILLSFLIILVNPNIESPANIDNSKLYRDNYDDYKKKIYKIIAQQ
jgi:ubiquitin-conjugating enzyme E2 G1